MSVSEEFQVEMSIARMLGESILEEEERANRRFEAHQRRVAMRQWADQGDPGAQEAMYDLHLAGDHRLCRGICRIAQQYSADPGPAERVALDESDEWLDSPTSGELLEMSGVSRDGGFASRWA